MVPRTSPILVLVNRSWEIVVVVDQTELLDHEHAKDYIVAPFSYQFVAPISYLLIALSQWLCS